MKERWKFYFLEVVGINVYKGNKIEMMIVVV